MYIIQNTTLLLLLKIQDIFSILLQFEKLVGPQKHKNLLGVLSLLYYVVKRKKEPQGSHFATSGLCI